jgi:hypothetical protein
LADVASIIQRAGIVPLSIAGIFKEVTTISISAWVFGDQLTELNIIGVVITISGKCLSDLAMLHHLHATSTTLLFNVVPLPAVVGF